MIGSRGGRRGRDHRASRSRKRVRDRASRRCQPEAPARYGDRRVGLTEAGHPVRVTFPERCLVADFLYAVLLIGVFLLLAGVLRGLEKL
ncbi:hypothetical protein ATK36_1722 [Amycolatopsis sulphurea]|uniref:Uncharacterized protein n=1 Tax=Amycolatopsis sulphurea TaxID=76022 RepID=A0A2A9F8J3_9PSEU|nr:hypothetical protein ATK36_1722 [Amycolatopsis sulphurea]